MVDVSEILEDSSKLYDAMQKELATFTRLSRTGSKKEIQTFINSFRQNNHKGENGFALAMDWINIISPRYYIDGVNITTAMREYLAFEDLSAYPDWNYIRDEIRDFEERNVQDYMSCCLGLNNDKDNIYNQYIKAVKELNSFLGDADATREVNVSDFRTLVEKAIDARKKCQIVINFTSKMIPITVRKTYTEKSLSFEDAYETCQEIISNVRSMFYGTTSSSLAQMGVEAEELLGTNSNRSEYPSAGITHVMRLYITKYLEDECGVSRRLYNKYTGTPSYLPIKKLVLALASYIEPYTNLYAKSEESCISENVERFMNQHSMSLDSFFETVTEFDEMTDETAKVLLEDGLPLDSFAFMLKTFAKTAKDLK